MPAWEYSRTCRYEASRKLSQSVKMLLPPSQIVMYNACWISHDSWNNRKMHRPLYYTKLVQEIYLYTLWHWSTFILFIDFFHPLWYWACLHNTYVLAGLTPFMVQVIFGCLNMLIYAVAVHIKYTHLFSIYFSRKSIQNRKVGSWHDI